MPPALTHYEFRLKVCCICLNESGKKPDRKISKFEEEYICQNIILGYSSEDCFLPIGICDTCHFRIIQDKKDVNCSIKVSESYNLIKRTTRSVALEQEGVCSCIICQRGKLCGLELRRYFTILQFSSICTLYNVPVIFMLNFQRLHFLFKNTIVKY